MKSSHVFVTLRPHVPTTLFYVALILLSVSMNVSSAQTAPEKPVTPVPVKRELLDGTRLVLKGAGCSLDLPGPGWAWMTYEGAGQSFLCVNQKTAEIYIVGIGQLKHDLVEHQPQSLVAGAKKKQAERGGTVENDKYEFIETPGTKKSCHITFTEVEQSKKLYAYIYLFQTVDFTLLKVHCNTPYATEPEAFKRMLKSLKMLTP